MAVPRHHAYPFGRRNQLVKDVLSQHRLTMRTTGFRTIDHLNDWDTIDLHDIKGVDADVANNDELEQLKSVITHAIENNKICVTFNHEIDTLNGSSFIRYDCFISLLDWLVEQPIEIVTMDKLYQRVIEYRAKKGQ
jgi:hypothetical protein